MFRGYSDHPVQVSQLPLPIVHPGKNKKKDSEKHEDVIIYQAIYPSRTKKKI